MSGCKAYFKSSVLGGKIKDYDIESILSKDNVHYNIEVKQKGSTRNKLNNYPYPNTHKFIDIKCSDQEREYYWKKVLNI
ncbi:hypothetical protein GCM10023211_02430 [Orbus sasakiae]|uniref:PD(D/E)XK endonuclease domain-containing protein n=1 Tax=Orbus sasakiae TaxID=1078475 RepID=A0ABP9MYH1_9GAMM